MEKITLGRKGEKIAERYLLDLGFKIIDKNFQTKFGEIDIIAQDKGDLVFVEVKTRVSTKFGLPEEAVTPRKIKRIVKAAAIYRNQKKNLPDIERIDVVAIKLKNNGDLERIELIRNITS